MTEPGRSEILRSGRPAIARPVSVRQASGGSVSCKLLTRQADNCQADRCQAGIPQNGKRAAAEQLTENHVTALT